MPFVSRRLAGRCLAVILMLTGAGPVAAQSLVSTLNGSVGAFAGYGRQAGDNGFLFNASNPPNQNLPPPPGGCTPSASCFILGGADGRLNGLMLGGEARVSAPLGQSFGLQADGVAGAFDGKGAGNVRGHAFAGQPGTGTIGPLVQYSWLGNGGLVRAGLEGQLWLGPVSLYASGGWQWADASDDVRVSRGVFACGEARWYADDNAYIGVGGDWTSTRVAAFANGEVQLAGDWRPLSLYARGGLGGDGYRSVLAGFRWQFGPGQTLLARHRQDLLLPYAACGEEQFFSRKRTDFFFAVE